MGSLLDVNLGKQSNGNFGNYSDDGAFRKRLVGYASLVYSLGPIDSPIYSIDK